MFSFALTIANQSAIDDPTAIPYDSSMIARGYGVSVEFDGVTVRIVGGKAQAAIWRTGSVEIPTADITDIEYKPATRLVNGHMTFTVRRAANDYATPRPDGMPTTVTANGLIAHWRRKDEAEFEALRDAITTKAAPPNLV